MRDEIARCTKAASLQPIGAECLAKVVARNEGVAMDAVSIDATPPIVLHVACVIRRRAVHSWAPLAVASNRAINTRAEAATTDAREDGDTVALRVVAATMRGGGDVTLVTLATIFGAPILRLGSPKVTPT
jgi:hypothetical protein